MAPRAREASFGAASRHVQPPDDYLCERIEQDEVGMALLVEAAQGDGYVRSVTIPDAPPTDW